MIDCGCQGNDLDHLLIVFKFLCLVWVDLLFVSTSLSHTHGHRMFIFRNKQYASASDALDEYIREFEMSQTDLRPSSRHKPTQRKESVSVVSEEISSLSSNDPLIHNDLNRHVDKLEEMINYLSVRIGNHRNDLFDNNDDDQKTRIVKKSTMTMNKPPDGDLLADYDPIVRSLSSFENLNKELMLLSKNNKTITDSDDAWSKESSNDFFKMNSASNEFFKMNTDNNNNNNNRASSTPTQSLSAMSFDNLINDIKTVLH